MTSFKNQKAPCRKCQKLWHKVGMVRRTGSGLVCPECAAGMCTWCGKEKEDMAVFHGQPLCKRCLEVGKRADPECPYCRGTGYDASSVDRWVRCSCRG